MTLTLHSLATQTFSAMLQSLSECLDKAVAQKPKTDILNTRLAPDMFTFAQQVQQATFYVSDALSRLSGKGAAPMPDAKKTLNAVRKQLTAAIAAAKKAPAFRNAETVDCSFELPNNMIVAMDGERYLRAWALPHFYFHVVTAYDILRSQGVKIGK